MKTLLITLILAVFSVFCNQLQAQSFKGYYKSRSYKASKINNGPALEIGGQTNRSIGGWKTGWNVDVAWSNKFRVGYFRTAGRTQSEQAQSSEQGVEFSFMFNSNGKVAFGPQMRFTVTDKRFVSLIPMVQSRVSISSKLAIKGGVGMSDRYPIFDMGMVVRLK